MKSEWPDGMEMIRQMREALGLFSGAMSISPRQAWQEALDEARRLKSIAPETIKAEIAKICRERGHLPLRSLGNSCARCGESV